MPDLSVSVIGFDQFAATLRKLASGLPAAMGDALYQDMVGVMVESKQLVPVDTGALRDSGEVDRPEVSSGSVSVSLHYGSATVDYALKQHEDLTLRHPHGGQSKFLEQPLHAWADKGPQTVAERAIHEAAR